jgi:transcription elongation factor Elf1
VTDINRAITTIRCPDCGSAVQITVEHFRNNKPIVCGGCNRTMTLRDADRSIEDYLKNFKAAAEDLDRRTKR